MDEKKIIASLRLRPGMPEDLVLRDMLSDCIADLKALLHVDTLNEEHESILKELVLIKINHDGADGILSESHSGVTTTYLDDLPKALRRRIYAKRKFAR